MKFSFKKIMYNDQMLKLFSIAAAIVFWFIIVSNVDTEYDKTIYNVPISESESTSSSDTYSIIDMSQSKVKIEVTGPRYLIGKLSPDDFTLTLRNGKATEAGKRTVQLRGEFKDPDSRVRIKKIVPSSVTVYYDKVISRTLPVTIKMENTSAAENYTISGSASVPNFISVSGPETEVEKLGSAVVTVNAGKNITADVTKTADIVLYDSDGKQADTKYLSTDASQADVTLSVLKKKDVPLTVKITGLPTGVSMDCVEYSVTPPSVSLAGEGSFIDSLASISLGSIDFRSLKLTNTFEYKITIPDQASALEDYGTAEVSVNLLNTGTKTVTVDKISVSNVPDGYKVKVKTKKIDKVLLYGPSSGISSVSGAVAVADLSDVKMKTGTFKVPVTISVPSLSGCWTTKDYKVTISASKS